LDYKTLSASGSLAQYAAFVCDLHGGIGLQVGEETGRACRHRKDQPHVKAGLVYNAIDESGGFYRGHAKPEARSLMNVPFRLPSEELEDTFAKEAKKADLIGLKGHRSVGGMRASIYNAMTVEGTQALVQFMKEFQKKNG
jgi:phosphoserine aminotransferase